MTISQFNTPSHFLTPLDYSWSIFPRWISLSLCLFSSLLNFLLIGWLDHFILKGFELANKKLLITEATGPAWKSAYSRHSRGHPEVRPSHMDALQPWSAYLFRHWNFSKAQHRPHLLQAIFLSRVAKITCLLFSQTVLSMPIYWADMGIMPNQWQDCPRTVQALVPRCYSPQKPWDRDNAAFLESQESRVHLSGHQWMHLPPSRTLRLSMTEARDSPLSPYSKGYGTFFSFLKYYYYNISGTMVDACTPRSWADTSREIASSKPTWATQIKSKHSGKKGGGNCKCVSVIDNSCNLVRPRVQSPTPQSIYLKYTTNILICIYSVRQFY